MEKKQIIIDNEIQEIYVFDRDEMDDMILIDKIEEKQNLNKEEKKDE